MSTTFREETTMAARWYRIVTAIIGGLASLLLGAEILVAGESQSQLPRYRLQVGQELVYRGGSELNSDERTFIRHNAWHVWVVREDADGSWRLLARHGDTFSVRPRTKTKKEAPDNKPGRERITFGWCDVFPDGRIVENGSLNILLQPSKLLPRLPGTRDEAERGWTARNSPADETIHYRVLSDPHPSRCLIEAIAKSATNVSFGIDETLVTNFDMERGLPEKITSETRQERYPTGQGKGAIELVAVQTRSAESAHRLADEAERYFNAIEAHESLMRRRDLGRDAFEAALQKDTEELRKLGESLHEPELNEGIAQHLKINDAYVQEVLVAAAIRDKLMGKPSEDWATTDLDGKEHSLKDYRGKVVVLDFWYRGCGYCILGMPQIKEVAAHFQDRPVVVLGMNTDEDLDDAKFVVNKLDIRYTNLRAKGLPEKYHLQGFPALLILDQDGVVRDYHDGYSPTLREEVVKTVELLLGPKS
jgi:thiol-disulfide isomerase/thioredoxin